ncbi:uncharacterized protein BDW70DRAFT_165881 [Aspergillus foveolatus]|uniref:uncharacterized protein n=1 Tax=Aspergillus foveolatus TaxID=210207 RepID=UPI003CCE2F7F
MSRRAWSKVMEAITGRGSKVWEKLVKPTVGRGKTQWLKSESDLENQGVRFDYDGNVEDNGQSTTSTRSSQMLGRSLAFGENGETSTVGLMPSLGQSRSKQDATKDEVGSALKSLEEKL